MEGVSHQEEGASRLEPGVTVDGSHLALEEGGLRSLSGILLEEVEEVHACLEEEQEKWVQRRERVWGLQEVKAEGGLGEKTGSGWVVEYLGLEEVHQDCPAWRKVGLWGAQGHCFSNQDELRGV